MKPMEKRKLQGQLIVDDEKKFRQAYCDGIGPDKAYGYGMLLLV